MANELNIGGILASLELDVSGIKKSVDQTNQELRRYQQTAENANRSVAQSFAGMQRTVSGSIATLTRGLGLLGVSLGAASLLGFAKDALASASELTNLSKALGITTTEVQELQYAFRQYQVTSEQVSQATTMFSKNLGELNANTGAFRQFLRDSAPQFEASFRGVTNVADGYSKLADVIQRLKNPQDQLLVAQRALGEEMGRKLLPALQQGGDAFAKLRDEAQKTGSLMDESAVRSADRLNKAFDNLAATTAQKLKKAIVDLAAAFVDLEGNEDKQVERAETFLNQLLEQQKRLKEGWFTYQSQLDANAKAIEKATERLAKARNAQWAAGTTSTAAKSGGGESLFVEDPKVTAQREAMIQGLLSYYEQLAMTGDALRESFVQPMELAKKQQDELNNLLRRGVINADEFGKAAARSAYTMHAAYADAAGAVANAVSRVFEDNKGVAVAAAIIDTYAAANKALAAPPGPPISYAYVAAALATGFANVRNILSTSKSTTSMAGGGAATSGGGAAAAASGGGASTGAGLNQTLFVQGISHSQLYSGAAVDELMRAIIERQRDGVKVVLEAT